MAPKKIQKKEIKFYQAVGRRKTSTAHVKLFLNGKKEILINHKNFQNYFPSFFLQKIVLAPLEIAQNLDTFQIIITVKGGGKVSQAEAIRHGISRALVQINPELRKKLKKAGYLKRDPRMKERKKFGLKRARKAPQWQKR